MPVPLNDVLNVLPPKRRAMLDRRFKELVDEVSSLKKPSPPLKPGAMENAIVR